MGFTSGFKGLSMVVHKGPLDFKGIRTAINLNHIYKIQSVPRSKHNPSQL